MKMFFLRRDRMAAALRGFSAAVAATRWPSMLFALVMAVTLWYLVTVRDKVETWVDVRLEFKSAPADLVIRSGLINKISVRVRAAKGLSRGLTDRGFSVAIDLSNIGRGTNTIAVTPAMLPFSPAFEIMDISPPRFQVLADGLESRKVLLESAFEATLAGDLFVKSLRLNPPTAVARGPESIVSRTSVLKVPVSLNADIKAGVMERVVDIPAPDGVSVNPAKVLVTLEVGVRTKTVRLKRQVRVEAPEGHTVKLTPPRVTLEVAVPESQAGKQDVLATVTATVTVPQEARGTVRLPVKVLLPENSSLKSVTPKELTAVVQSGKATRAGGGPSDTNSK